MLELPEAYRTVLIMRHYEDLKFREIAEVLDIPEGTVKSRMAEAMNLLTKSFQKIQRGPHQGTSKRPSTGSRETRELEVMIL